MNARLGHRLNSMTSQISTSPTGSSYLQSNSRASRNSFKSPDDEKTYVKESFVPPEISMINFFLNIVSSYLFYSVRTFIYHGIKSHWKKSKLDFFLKNEEAFLNRILFHIFINMLRDLNMNSLNML